jgi:hypothetical protein
MAAPLLARAAAAAAPSLAPSAARLGTRAIAALAALPLVVLLLAVLVILGARYEQLVAEQGTGMASTIGIPAGLIPIYEEAERVHKVNAFLLASVHKQETDFSQFAGTYTVNGSGCAGPMQISVTPGSACGCLWCEASVKNAFRAGERPEQYPGQRSPHPSVYDNFDAIMAAAVILRGKVGGRPIPRLDGTAHAALCGYYGACSDSVAGNYAGDVLSRARAWSDESRTLGAGIGGPEGPLPLTPGERARILPNGLAAAPATAPRAVKDMIRAGNRINGKPYRYGGGHGAPVTSVQPAYDCSSSISHLLGGAGLLEVTLASGPLMTFGDAGLGRWVTIYSDPGHVYMYLAGIRWDTHGAGVDTGPNRGIGWHYGIRARRPNDAIRHPKGL